MPVKLLYWGIAIGLALVLDFFWMRVRKRYRLLGAEGVHEGGASRLRQAFAMEIQALRSKRWWRVSKVVLLEWGGLLLWAMYVGLPYLNLNENLVPAGREFGSSIAANHFWTQVQRCGWCAVWNGFQRGGYPALADMQSSALHPVVALATLLFGVVNGAKVTLVLSFWFAGLAQWWLARELGVSRLARLWSAAMAVVGGHLSVRMELGVYGMVFSTSMVSFVYAALLSLVNRGDRRATVLLGLALASALLAGQGYMQVGLFFTLPAVLVFFTERAFWRRRVWKNMLLAFGLAALLAAPFLMPFLHFAPNVYKETDAGFKTAQPLLYLPLNLVISDWAYYHTETLGKLPYPHLYGHYIGWVAVLLAVVGLVSQRLLDWRRRAFLALGVLLAFLTGSAVLLKALVRLYPALAGVRHASQIGGLAIPFLLGLAALGLDALLGLRWPFLWIGWTETASKWRVSLAWAMLVPLVMALKGNLVFSRYWIYNTSLTPSVFDLLEGLRTDSLQWVAPPFGEHFYVEPALRMGLKISPGIMTWYWKGRDAPRPVLEANRAGPPPDALEQVAVIDGIPIYRRDAPPYAAVVAGGEQYACPAAGSGGYLRIVCNAPVDGRLVVQENSWAGWYAWVDGRRTPLLPGNWLSVKALAGRHVYRFRYLPWDVPVGILCALGGIIWAIFLWRQGGREQGETKENGS